MFVGALFSPGQAGSASGAAVSTKAGAAFAFFVLFALSGLELLVLAFSFAFCFVVFRIVWEITCVPFDASTTLECAKIYAHRRNILTPSLFAKSMTRMATQWKLL